MKELISGRTGGSQKNSQLVSMCRWGQDYFVRFVKKFTNGVKWFCPLLHIYGKINVYAYFTIVLGIVFDAFINLGDCINLKNTITY